MVINLSSDANDGDDGTGDNDNGINLAFYKLYNNTKINKSKKEIEICMDVNEKTSVRTVSRMKTIELLVNVKEYKAKIKNIRKHTQQSRSLQYII